MRIWKGVSNDPAEAAEGQGQDDDESSHVCETIGNKGSDENSHDGYDAVDTARDREYQRRTKMASLEARNDSLDWNRHQLRFDVVIGTKVVDDRRQAQDVGIAGYRASCKDYRESVGLKCHPK